MSQDCSPWRSSRHRAWTFSLLPTVFTSAMVRCDSTDLHLPPWLWLLLLRSSWLLTHWHYYCGWSSLGIHSLWSPVLTSGSLSGSLPEFWSGPHGKAWLDTHQTPFSLSECTASLHFAAPPICWGHVLDLNNRNLLQNWCITSRMKPLRAGTPSPPSLSTPWFVH